MSKDSLNEISVTFGIFDFECPFEDISSEIGLTPSETLAKGVQMIKSPDGREIKRNIPQNMWLIKLRHSKHGLLQDQLNDHLREMFTKLKPAVDKIYKLSEQYTVELSIHGYADGPSVGFDLTKEDVKMLADLGATLDVDLYDVSEDE